MSCHKGGQPQEGQRLPQRYYCHWFDAWTLQPARPWIRFLLQGDALCLRAWVWIFWKRHHVPLLAVCGHRFAVDRHDHKGAFMAQISKRLSKKQLICGGELVRWNIAGADSQVSTFLFSCGHQHWSETLPLSQASILRNKSQFSGKVMSGRRTGLLEIFLRCWYCNTPSGVPCNPSIKQSGQLVRHQQQTRLLIRAYI